MRIYLFRGLAGKVFSRGLDGLAERLRSNSHETSVHSWVQRPAVQRSAIDAYQSGAQTEPIALIGHSLGGNSANFMANNLTQAGIPVAYVATIDPTEPRTNPNSVPSDNFRSRDFRAEKVPGAKDFFLPDLNHIQIDKDPRVHDRIISVCKDITTAPIPGSVHQANWNSSGLSHNEIMAALLRELLLRLQENR